MSGEMVPPQYSPSNAARSFTIRGRAKCPRRRARSFDEGVTVSRPSAVGRDVIVTLYTESNFSFRFLVCGSSIDTQLCRLHEAFLFRANLLACLSLAKHKSDRAARRWASRHKNSRRQNAVGIFCRCSQLRRAYFAQGRTIDREGQYPWVLASGGVKPLRKSRRLNLARLPACAVLYQNRVEWRRFAPQRLREGRPNRTCVRDRPRDVLVGAKVRRYTRFYSAT